jgi:hypothetical protein
MKQVGLGMGWMNSRGKELHWLNLGDPLLSILRQIYLVLHRDLRNVPILVDDCDWLKVVGVVNVPLDHVMQVSTLTKWDLEVILELFAIVLVISRHNVNHQFYL